MQERQKTEKKRKTPPISDNVPKSLFVSYIDYYYSRSTKLIWQQNVPCMSKAVKDREKKQRKRRDPDESFC